MLDALHALALSTVRGLGPKAVQRASAMAVDGAAGAGALAELVEAVRASAPRTKAVTRETLEEALEGAEATLGAAERQGIYAAAPGERAYPGLLRLLGDAPPVLFWRGDAAAVCRPSVAVVGTRAPSDYGRKSSRLLVGSGYTVVSGLALGCDSAAHQGCLDAGGVTVAVMAHGLDLVYPKAHTALAEQILDGGGALVSEHAPGVAPQRRSFVARNRIQSGLSLGVVVAESALDGGTMHTAAFALAQSRVLACVARPDGSPTSEGTDKLARVDGALAIDSPDAYDRYVERLRHKAESLAAEAASSRPRGGAAQPDLFR